MPGLLRLREAGFRIWPYDAPSVKKPLVVEIYTRLMTGAVNKSSEVARTAYLAKKRRENALYAGLSRGVMAKARGSEDAFDALVTAMVMVEHRGEFARLRKTEDEVFRMEGQTWVPGLVGMKSVGISQANAGSGSDLEKTVDRKCVFAPGSDGMPRGSVGLWCWRHRVGRSWRDSCLARHFTAGGARLKSMM